MSTCSMFAPKDDELIHPTRNPKKNQHGCDNYYWSRDESTTQIAHKSTLGLKSTPDLDGGPTSRRYRRTGVTQTRALTKVATLTWEASFARARPVYCALVRPAITYGSTPLVKKKSQQNYSDEGPIYRSRRTRNPPKKFNRHPIFRKESPPCHFSLRSK